MPTGKVDAGDSNQLFFADYTAVPSTSGDYTVTITVELADGTEFVASAELGTI